MAKARVEWIYFHSLKVSDKEDIRFELRREHKTIYKLEVYKKKTIKESDEYEYETMEQLLLQAESDGEAINLAVEIYKGYELNRRI